MQSHISSSKLNAMTKIMPHHQKSLRHAPLKAPGIAKSVEKTTLTNNVNHISSNQPALGPATVIKSSTLTTPPIVSTKVFPSNGDEEMHTLKIKIALFNDRLIEAQWGGNALVKGHGFSGSIPCDLVSSCSLDIISSTNKDVNKYANFDGIVHMAAKESGNRLVSMSLDTNWGNRIRVKQKQFKILYAGEGSMIPMDLYVKKFKFDALVNYRLSSEIFLGHGCGAINRLASMKKEKERNFYNPKLIFNRPGDVAIFVSNCIKILNC